jgi:hypothetical protein
MPEVRRKYDPEFREGAAQRLWPVEPITRSDWVAEGEGGLAKRGRALARCPAAPRA